jgi:hypothetical protein
VVGVAILPGKGYNMKAGDGRGKGNRSAAVLIATPEYVKVLDQLLLSESFVSRSQLIEVAIGEFAAKRGVTMPMRRASYAQYVHE